MAASGGQEIAQEKAQTLQEGQESFCWSGTQGRLQKATKWDS